MLSRNPKVADPDFAGSRREVSWAEIRMAVLITRIVGHDMLLDAHVGYVFAFKLLSSSNA